MRSSWIRVHPRSNDMCLYQRKHKDRGEGEMRMETETGPKPGIYKLRTPNIISSHQMLPQSLEKGPTLLTN